MVKKNNLINIYEKTDNILDESRQFFQKCVEVRQQSNQIMNTSSKLINENKHLIEEATILKEEMIAKKCEALSILDLVVDIQGLSKDDPIYYSYEEEQQLVQDMIEDLKLNHIPKEKTALTKLKDHFLALSYIPK